MGIVHGMNKNNSFSIYAYAYSLWLMQQNLQSWLMGLTIHGGEYGQEKNLLKLNI